MTEHLAALNERRARVLAEASARVTDLACAIVARIAPDFDARSVVPPLVMQAVEAAQAEQFLMLRVHPSGREEDRKSVVQGKSVSVRVDLGGRRIIKKKITLSHTKTNKL